MRRDDRCSKCRNQLGSQCGERRAEQQGQVGRDKEEDIIEHIIYPMSQCTENEWGEEEATGGLHIVQEGTELLLLGVRDYFYTSDL